ncbi:isopenicillin N synthase family oxygenase [Polymorphobacter arshaanensis]|uniref:2-oxoglutarate-dependent ethylene/succinate-forming enzyme n=1 Tax=Glacieibacterium arshaanense TaxID=2511025 RepID=A0A4Y9ERK3_9SPHN|nr:2-oxoglutarate and iron-dependent oxygenase domain-containing protein [Polymorphobacter arshaanensis]TFU06255.1 isopenicillin N synthase family oxygenase [Polymorphobacter arshaanensis]
MTATADITPIPLTLADRDAAAAFGDAFERTGFAVVTDHGVDGALVARVQAAAAAFFALPEATKRRYLVGQGGARGYTPFGIETAKDADRPDLKEFWHTGRDLPAGHPAAVAMPPNVWPAEIADFEPAVRTLFSALDGAGARVLRAIALHLGLAANYFVEPVRDGNGVLRLLHYPPLAPGVAGERAAAHEDINVITLLFGAEEAGLQLRDRAGQWRDIAVPDGALVCNIGDMLQRLTNHRLPSTTHRVINPAPERAGRARYSMPFFLHFAPDFVIRTLPGCIDKARPDRYPEAISADAYLQQRLREIGLLGDG